MERFTTSWYSPAVQREMSVARWGDYGKPVLLFSTAGGDCLDYERFKLIAALEPLVASRRIKVYSADSITRDAWMKADAHPRQKTWLQARFGDYLEQELLPWIQQDCGGYRGYVAAGASLGAYNALNAATRLPHWFDLTVAMSGTYDFDRWMDGHRDQDYYFHQPMYFLAGMPDGAQLHAMRQNRFVIATGSGRAEAPDESRRVAELLRRKGVDQTWLEIWGADVHHDWPTWRTMLPMFLDKLLP